MTFTAQLGTVNSMLGQLVLDYWAFTVIPPDHQPVWAPLWLVEIERGPSNP